MSYLQSTYHSKIYRDFKAIEATAYRNMIHFYEKQESEIRALDFDENFELLTCYVNALFEVGYYRKHLLIVDVVIETAISNNIDFYKGEDIFLKMLFRKAASLYNLLEYEKSEYILREIIRINPWDKDAIQFLKKCKRRQQPRYLQYARATSIFLFLTAAVIIALEVLFVRTFYRQLVLEIEQARFVIFGIGGVLLIGADLFHRLRTERQVNAFVQETRLRKG
jgi:tetratricopeptide (TPR) repeat protein